MARRLLLALAVALPSLGVGLFAPFAFGADAEPTITFTTSGTPPLVCGTHPNLRSLTVSTGTEIIIANLTEVAASVDVGNKKVLDLAPGTGALVKLKPGQHELRLIPDCAVVTDTEVAVVTVQAHGQPPDAPPPSGDPDDPVESAGPDSTDSPVTMTTTSPTGTAGPAVGGSGAADPGAGGTTATAGPGVGPAGPMAPSGGASGVAGSARPAAVDELNGSLESEVIAVRPIDLGGSRDPKGVRLLAVIAAICVFGVTAAIIRAIVSQRTTSTVTI